MNIVYHFSNQYSFVNLTIDHQHHQHWQPYGLEWWKIPIQFSEFSNEYNRYNWINEKQLIQKWICAKNICYDVITYYISF